MHEARGIYAINEFMVRAWPPFGIMNEGKILVDDLKVFDPV